MRKLLLLLLFVPFIAQAGWLSQAENPEKPVEVIFEVPGVSKDDLFTRSKTWIAETFVSGKSVLDSAERESGTIIAKGYIKKPCDGFLNCMATGNNKIGFTMRIDTKDGKVRTTYSNFTVFHPGTTGSVVGNVYTPGTDPSETPIHVQGVLDDAHKGVMALSEELKAYLQKETTSKNDW